MKFLFSSKLIPLYFVAPVFAIHLLVVAFPSLSSLALSLTDWNGFGKINYIGFENFIELFDDRVFKKAVKHNLIWTAFFLTVPIAVAMLGAYLLTGIKRFQLFSLLTKTKIIALGGILQKNLKQLSLIRCDCFAGISFFE